MEGMPHMKISGRVRHTVDPPLTGLMAEARRRAAQGRDIIPLAQAFVDYAPPDSFLQALAGGLAAPGTLLHRYTPDPGLDVLRGALSRYLRRAFVIDADPTAEILVTPGANQAAFTAISAVLDPGDEALLPAPYYFNHEMTVRLAGGVPRVVDGSMEGGFMAPVSQLAESWTPRLRAVVLVHPGNPTGAMMPAAWIRELAGLMTQDPRWRRIWLITDQTYQEIYFGEERPLSPASIPGMQQRTVTVGSFSKSLALAGWRLGFLCGPGAFVSEAMKIQDSSVICAPHAAQFALAATLDDPGLGGYLEDKRRVLRERRDALLSALLADGRLRVRVPDGACFAFAGLPDGIDGACFSRDLLEHQDVAAVPGAAFGESWAGFLRLGFGHLGESRLREGAARILRQLSR